jgi:ribosomal protein L30/L7E
MAATQETESCKVIVVVKIRGEISGQREAKETNAMLGLTHTNHAVIIDSRPAYKGMLQATINSPTKPRRNSAIKPSTNSQKPYLTAKSNTTNSKASRRLSDCARQRKATKARRRRASEQAAKQATAAKPSTS